MLQRLFDFVIQRKITQRNTRRRRLHLSHVESLESRIALSASPGTVTLDGGQLTICGDDSDNRIIIAEVNGQIFVAGDFLATPEFFPIADVTSIEVTGGAGNDVITAASMTTAVTIDGEAGDDQLFGGTAADTLSGGDGTDLIIGNAGVDTIDGGAGDDTVIAGAGNDIVNGGDGVDIIVGDDGDDSLNGDNGNDTVLGAAGDDSVGGGNGDDTLVGGNGNDALSGAAGQDRLFGVGGDDELEGGDDDDLIFGGLGRDTITGLLGDDDLVGGGGVDVVSGGDGADDIMGGDDRDILIGGTGSDNLRGQAGEDVLVSGSSSVESNIPALAALSAVWDTTESYEDRIANLQRDLGSDNSDDAGDDILRGEGGTDWFFTSGAGDQLEDIESNEIAAGRELVAINDNYDIATGETFTTTLANGLLANDLNPGAGTLSVTTTPITSPQNGTVTLFGDGTFTYVHSGTGTEDSFTYEVTSSDDGSTAEATVKFSITPNNAAPVAIDDTLSGDEDNTITGNVLTNDTDADGDTLTASILTQPTSGTASIQSDGSVTYTPNAEFSGSDSFTYEVADPDGLVSQGTVSVTVNAINDAPVATNRSFSVASGTPLSTTAGTDDLLTISSDAEGDTLTASIATQPSNGSVQLNADGTFTYTPNAGFSGSDSFTYVVNDGQTDSAVGTITINVDNPNTFQASETLADGSLIGTVQPTNLNGSLVYEFADAASSNASLLLNPDDHFSGDLDASVVMIEYLDLQCPFCAALHPTIQSLKSDFPEDLLVVTRHLPLSSIHPNAIEAAQFAEAAGEQGMFDELVDVLFTRQTEWSGLSDPTSTFEGYATDLGLNLSQITTAVANQATTDRINRDTDVARNDLGLTGTPSVFIQGSEFNSLVESALATEISDRLSEVTTPFAINRMTGEIRVRDSSILDFETQSSYTFDVRVSDGTTTETVPVTIDLNDINDESAIPALPSDATIQTTASGLQFYDFEVGDGPSPSLSDSARLAYVGYLPNGNIFDSNPNTTFPLGGVIQGFAEGLEGMNAGGRRRIIIPPDLGYGSGGNPGAGIGGTDTIVFDVVLHEVP